jgi:large conductance mechanosensitive channel
LTIDYNIFQIKEIDIMKESKFASEFKAFITRGNVVDMAVGVIIGGAFTAIVNSLVKDMLMPIIGALFGGINFNNLKIVLREATETAEEAAICYGAFIQAIVNFLLVALCIFLLVKAINKARDAAEAKKKAAEEAAPAPEPEEPVIPEDILLLREIRDSLKKD